MLGKSAEKLYWSELWPNDRVYNYYFIFFSSDSPLLPIIHISSPCLSREGISQTEEYRDHVP